MEGRHIYLIGSLRNPQIPLIAQQLREDGHDVFDDWYAAGPNADDHWRDYEKGRGHSFREALGGFAARHVYAFDREHLERATDVILVLPAGKSGHLELGVSIGQRKNAYVLLDNPERWDVMYQFATGVFDTFEQLRAQLQPLKMTSYCTHCGIPVEDHLGVRTYAQHGVGIADCFYRDGGSYRTTIQEVR